MNKEAIIDIENPKDNDLISRQAVQIELKKCEVIDVHDENDNLVGYYNTDTVDSIVRNLFPVNPQPKTGHWINVNEGKWNTIPAYKCSECGANADLRDWSGESPFCPWCGAKMIKPQERSDKE